ncbi:uncharacterized protein rab44 isoform X3 [Kryptolebias marmoratus]|uniref:uncharacterized protein rab44 isoform X3 n=1 Tax=Kryptolebias marmoratus TaxID=37003 RepID=UPI0018ACCEEE|nr:uncharacterized protein rab44 isoform X3 [Kryptolebias marmoratus]
MPVSPDSSMSLMPLTGHSSEVQSSVPTAHPETDPQTLIPKSENIQDLTKHQQGRETEINIVIVERSVDDTQQDVDQSDTHHSEDIRNVLSDDAQLEGQEIEIHATKMQESQQTSSETGTGNATESLKVVSGPLKDLSEITELTIKSYAELETTQKSLQTTTVSQQESKEDLESDLNLPVSHDRSMFAMFMPGHSSEVHSTVTQSYPKPDLESFVAESKSPPKHQDERETDINVETSEKSEETTPVDQSDTVLSKEVISPDDSVTAVEPEQIPEEQTTEIQERLPIWYSSNTITNDAPVNLKIVFENQKDQAETINTLQSEFTDSSTVDSVAKQDDVSSSDKEITISTEEDSLEAVVQINYDDHVQESKQTSMNDTEKDYTVLMHKDEGGDLVEEDIKHSSEQSVHQEGIVPKAEIASVHLQSTLSDLNVSSDPQLQDKSLSTDEQTDANLSLSGNKRKLGSSRRNKGRQRGKEPKGGVIDSTMSDEALDTAVLEIKSTRQDKTTQDFEHDIILSFSHDSTMSVVPSPCHSSEIQSSVPTAHPEIDPESIIPKSENLPEDHDERRTQNIVGLEKQLVDDTKEDVDKSDTPHTEVIRNVLSDDSQLEGQAVEVQPTQMQESQQINFSVQTVTSDATESCHLISEPLTDLETSELTTKTTDKSTTQPEEYPTGENLSEASDLKQDNYDLHGINKQQISDLKEVELSVSQIKESKDTVDDDDIKPKTYVFDQEKEGLLIDTEEKKSAALAILSETGSLDSQPQNDSVNVSKQTNTGFTKSGNKRKLGSTRRNKGRQQVEEFKGEVLENTKGDSALERTNLTETKTTEQKELTEDTKRDNLLSVSQASSMSFMPLPDHSEVQSSRATDYPETETQTLILGSQSLEDDRTEREPDSYVQLVEETAGAMQLEINKCVAFHSDDLLDNAQREVQKVESHPTQMQGSLQIECSSEGFTGGHIEISEQQECFTKENEGYDSNNASKPQSSDLKEVDSALHQGHEFKDKVEDDMKPKCEQVIYQEKAEFSSTTEENKRALSTLQSKSVSFDSQPQNDSLSVHERTSMDFHNSGSRRKLGSSRRNKGRQTVKDSVTETNKNPIQEDEEKASSTKLSETALTVESTGQKEENIDAGAFGWTSELTSVGVLSTSNADEMVVDKSLIPDGDLSSIFSMIDTRSRQTDESTEPPVQDRSVEENVLVSEPEVRPVTAEINTDKSISREETDPEDQVEKASPNSNITQSPQHTEDGVEKVHEQEADQTEGVFHIYDTAEKESDHAAEKTEIMTRNVFDSTKSKEKDEETETLRRLSDSGLSATPERSTENSSYKDHAEVEYSVEQEAYSSPQDNLPTNEEQDESTKTSTAIETLHSEDIAIKDHEEQINPEQMQEMHQIDFISLTQSKSTVQTLQPDANVALESDSQDNYEGNKDETHSGLKTAGIRRKLGSSRRIKAKQDAKFTEANQEHKEEGVENSENNEATQMFATETIQQRESDDLKSAEKLETISSTEEKKAEKQQEEDEDLDNRTVSTSDNIPSSDQEDYHESVKDTKEKRVKLVHDPDISIQLPGYDTDKKGFLMQSTEASVSKDDSDMESVLYHDDTVIPEPGSVSVPDQDEATHHQNREAETPEQEVQLQQTSKATETVVCVPSKDRSTEVASSVNVQDPELSEAGEKRICADQEVNASPESISASEEPPVDASYISGISTTMDAGNSQQETTSSDFSDSLEVKSKHKRRKFGSSRRTPVNKKQEGEAHSADVTKTESSTEDGMRGVEKMKVVEEFPSTAEGVESENVQPLHGALVQREAAEARTAESDEHRLVQATAEQKPESTSERIHSPTVEVKSASPDFSSTNRRREMGSTHKNLGSQSKTENLDQEELEIGATKSETTRGGISSENVWEVKEANLQVQAEYKVSSFDQRKEKVFETVAVSHIDKALIKPLAEQTPEEDPVSLSHNDSASGGRRKKFGSNRKTRSQQRNKDQNECEVGLIEAQNENDAGGIPEEGAPGAAVLRTDKSPDLDNIPEDDGNGDKASASISIPETKLFSKSVRETTSRTLYPDEIPFGQGRERQLFFGTDRSNCYNVVLVGESSVGKSSFMKRAQTGKFAVDIPASIALDSCKWTVLVDGKPVVLQLWDTAGQERFHSITRHVFHKAQAFLLMYDITSSQSFSAVSYWANSIQESAAENVTVLLLGNKSDHAERQVKTEQGDILAKEYSFGFMECSAATGKNVVEALETVARMLSRSSDSREEATVLHRQQAQTSQSRCC